MQRLGVCGNIPSVCECGCVCETKDLGCVYSSLSEPKPWSAREEEQVCAVYVGHVYVVPVKALLSVYVGFYGWPCLHHVWVGGRASTRNTCHCWLDLGATAAWLYHTGFGWTLGSEIKLTLVDQEGEFSFVPKPTKLASLNRVSMRMFRKYAVQ